MKFYGPKWYPFNNFAAYAVTVEHTTYPTSEHAYQATKFLSQATENADLFPVAEAIRTAPSPNEALHIATEYKDLLNHDQWDRIKVPTMFSLCEKKLSQHAIIGYLLRSTGKAEIVENSPVDSYWGTGPDGNGLNYLGRIWMNLRTKHWEELPKESPYPNQYPLIYPDQISDSVN